MTREELRAKAIEVMEDAYEDALHSDNSTVRDTVTAAIDGLGLAGFRVLGPEVTKEMRATRDTWDYTYIPDDAFMAMVRAGDLTRKPE